jgi:hypothetical protein
MKQFYSEYENWEDFKNGMYNIPEYKNEDRLVSLAIELLTDNELFLNTCKLILKEWPISSKVNLTNTGCNRRAWLGQAACCYKFNVPEMCTRIAWGKMSMNQQSIANSIADKIINSFEVNYERQNTELYKNLGE